MYQPLAAAKQARAAFAAAIGADTQRRFEARTVAAFGGVDGFASPDWPTSSEYTCTGSAIFLRGVGPRSLTLRSSLLHLTIGVLGKTDRARLANALEARGNVDAVAHEIAVALLDHVAEMNADTKLDAPILGYARVPLHHRVLHFDGATHGVHDAAELDDRAASKKGVGGPSTSFLTRHRASLETMCRPAG